MKRLAASPDGKSPAGRASTYLHDTVNEGDIIDVKAPASNFCLDTTQRRPIVLIGAGIGITPLLSMLFSVIIATN